MSNRSGGPGPPLFSVFCFSKRPPARHPEVARPPTDPEIKKRRPGPPLACFLFSVFQNARPPATPRRLGPPQCTDRREIKTGNK